MGMFDAFLRMKEEESNVAALKQIEINEELEAVGSRAPPLKVAIDQVFEDTAGKKRHFSLTSKKLREDAAFGVRLRVNIRQACLVVRDSSAFTNFITLTILLVGLIIGFETNWTLMCYRMKNRIVAHDTVASDFKYESECGEELLYSVVVGILSQTIFTIEVVVKLLAEGGKPMRFFRDRENGSWNRLVSSLSSGTVKTDLG